VRVVLLVTDLELGGTPLRLARLARGLTRLGVEVAVGCLAPRGPVSTVLEADGVPTFACEASGPTDWTAARLVGGWLGLPVLTSTATIERERPWHIWLEHATAGLDAGHLVCGRALAEHVQEAFGRPPETVYVVPPLIEWPQTAVSREVARRCFDLTDDVFTVVWTGRFDPVKRLDVLVDVAEALAREPFRFLLAGDGPVRPRIERRVGEGPARASVRLLGWQAGVAPLMAAGDALFFPSLTEGMPNAVLEALVAGLPVVGSGIPALRELAERGAPLMLVSDGGAAAYADALRRLRGDPAGRRVAAERALGWARENLDPAAAVQSVLRVYESVLSR
jgi:glycosyltransferase involved in cell wall biosynthesis